MEFINYREFHRPKLEWPRALLCKIDRIVPRKLADKLNYYFPHFTKFYLRESKPIYSSSAMTGVAAKYDTVICGSDQIWAPNVFNPIYFLSFVNGDSRKISYAASIGLPQIPTDKRDAYKSLLGDFDAISVREEEGVALLAGLGIAAQAVCDPTFLLSMDDYKRISTPVNSMCAPYVYCYLLGKNRAHRVMARKIADSMKQKLVIYSRYDEDAEHADEHVKVSGPRDFIGRIAGATMVLTDSFHGIAFSIIFRKSFYAFERFAANDPINQNSRVYNVLRACGLQNRLIAALPESIQMIDYSMNEQEINRMITKSKDYLADNIISQR